MTLVRWNPAVRGTARNLTTLHDELDRMLDTFLGPEFGRESRLAAGFPVDVEETKDAFVFRADLPGLSPDEVQVNLRGDTLTIRGQRRDGRGDKSGDFRRIERAFGAFERSFTLGTPVRNDQVRASYRNGVLEIRVPKAEEAREREIEIQVG